ncbi:hypothetical protein HOD38_02085 [archaeon]|nr:hypothetical protein [archaeon]MBT4397033.1 hypothetical protein [archaeon]MBT4441024.1 hypothetical protein [archaeon]
MEAARSKDLSPLIYDAETYLSCGTLVYPKGWHSSGIEDKIERDMAQLSRLGRPPELKMIRPGNVRGLSQMADPQTYGSSAMKPPADYQLPMERTMVPPPTKYSREYIENKRMMDQGWQVAKEVGLSVVKLGLAVGSVFVLYALTADRLMDFVEGFTK